MTAEESFEVVRAFSKALATVLATMDDMPTTMRTTECALDFLSALSGEEPESWTPDQKRLLAQLTDFFQEDIKGAIQNAELLKNPQ